jgi:hypothetical protein
MNVSLGGFLTLKPNEEEFITAVQRGELLPELLFPDDPQEAERIAAHPSILWKMENVRNYLARSAMPGKGDGAPKRRKS